MMYDEPFVILSTDTLYFDVWTLCPSIYGQIVGYFDVHRYFML